MPTELRSTTVRAMRISSCVLRSGACSESICDNHALCASCRWGKTSCRRSSNGNVQSWSFTRSPGGSLGHRAEHRNRDVVGDRPEVDLDGLADAQLLEGN